MKKFLSQFSPMLVNLMIGSLVAFVAGEILLTLVTGIFFTDYLADAVLGYALGNIISIARLLHMCKVMMGTLFYDDRETVQFFSGKGYAVRTGVTLMAWVCVYYFLGLESMLFAMLGTMLSSKVAVYLQPITDKYAIQKIFK